MQLTKTAGTATETVDFHRISARVVATHRRDGELVGQNKVTYGDAFEAATAVQTAIDDLIKGGFEELGSRGVA